MIKKIMFMIFILVFIIICLINSGYFSRKEESACKNNIIQDRNSNKQLSNTDILTTTRVDNSVLYLNKTPSTDKKNSLEPDDKKNSLESDDKKNSLESENINPFEKDYRKNLEQIREKLVAMDFDFKEMTKKLHKKLKESKTGKLTKEEMLELLPENIAKEFEEAMDITL